MSIIKKILLPLTIALIITAIVVSAEMDGKNEGGEMAAMADAIKYLQSLDKVYGQAARPRFEQVLFNSPVL